MRITIFGGGGFIGSAITDRLLHDGHKLRIFERPRVQPHRTFTSVESVEWMTGDILSKHDVDAAVSGAQAVVHLVSTTLPKNSNDDPIYDVQSNLVASLQLLNSAVANEVERLLFISSGGTIYGRPAYLPIDEQHPTDPEVSYGITKLAIEKYLLMYGRRYGIRPIILRVTNPFGERQRIETAQGAVGVFIHRALNDMPIEIWGDGSVTRDYLYVGDVADAFADAIAYQGDQRVFNISSGHGTTIDELITMIEHTSGKSIARIYKPGREFDVPTNVLENALARRELGWAPKISMQDGIARTIAWLRRS